jgi:hypothetical protein
VLLSRNNSRLLLQASFCKLPFAGFPFAGLFFFSDLAFYPLVCSPDIVILSQISGSLLGLPGSFKPTRRIFETI